MDRHPQTEQVLLLQLEPCEFLPGADDPEPELPLSGLARRLGFDAPYGAEVCHQEATKLDSDLTSCVFERSYV